MMRIVYCVKRITFDMQVPDPMNFEILKEVIRAFLHSIRPGDFGILRAVDKKISIQFMGG